jgi:hypothetical protein
MAPFRGILEKGERSMARDSSRYVTNVLVSFVANYRPTLEFFERKEAAMAEFYPKPFPHWARSDRHFNLVSKDTRRVIRFDANRFVVRAEGHPTMKPYEELITIATKMSAIFDVRDLFGAGLTVIRVREQPTRKDARTRFARMFLTHPAHDLMPMDGDTDYAVTFDRRWTVSTELIDMKPALAPLRLQTKINIGPTDHKEVGDRFVEFAEKADNELYKTEHVAPDFGILAAIEITLNRHKAKEGVPAAHLWRFHDWARTEAESRWAKIERAIE